jgi:hypothetical protein
MCSWSNHGSNHGTEAALARADRAVDGGVVGRGVRGRRGPELRPGVGHRGGPGPDAAAGQGGQRVPPRPAGGDRHPADPGLDREERLGRHRDPGSPRRRPGLGRRLWPDLGSEVRGVARRPGVDPGGRRLQHDDPADDALGQDPRLAVPRVRRAVAVLAHHVRRLVRAAAVLRDRRRQRPARVLRAQRRAHRDRALRRDPPSSRSATPITAAWRRRSTRRRGRATPTCGPRRSPAARTSSRPWAARRWARTSTSSI